MKSMTLRSRLVNDRFNTVEKLSCQLIGCQAIPYTLGGMEYVRTHLWNLFVIDSNLFIILHKHETHE